MAKRAFDSIDPTVVFPCRLFVIQHVSFQDDGKCVFRPPNSSNICSDSRRSPKNSQIQTSQALNLVLRPAPD